MNTFESTVNEDKIINLVFLHFVSFFLCNMEEKLVWTVNVCCTVYMTPFKVVRQSFTMKDIL